MREIVSRDKNNKLVYTYIVQTKTMLAFLQVIAEKFNICQN